MSWKCSVARFPKDPTGVSSTALPIGLPKSHRKPGNFSRDRQSAEIGQLIPNNAGVTGAFWTPEPLCGALGRTLQTPLPFYEMRAGRLRAKPRVRVVIVREVLHCELPFRLREIGRAHV